MSWEFALPVNAHQLDMPVLMARLMADGILHSHPIKEPSGIFDAASLSILWHLSKRASRAAFRHP